MEEGAKTKKLLWIGAAVIVLAAVFWLGTGWASSYYAEQGRTALNSGNFGEAKTLLERALFFNSSNAVAHARLGRALLGERFSDRWPNFPDADFNEAIKHYEKSFALNLKEKNLPLYRQAVEDAAQAYWAVDERDKAIETYLEKIAVDPSGSFWTRYLVARDYFDRSNKPEEAFNILLSTISLASDDLQRKKLAEIYATLARIAFYFDDFNKLESYAIQAIDADPERQDPQALTTAHALVALAKGRKKDFAAVEKEIDQARQLGNLGRTTSLECTRARAYYLGENYGQALNIVPTVKKPKKPSFFYSICLSTLANSHFALGNATEAKRYFQEYLAYTDAFQEKNIFVIRDREKFQKELRNP